MLWALKPKDCLGEFLSRAQDPEAPNVPGIMLGASQSLEKMHS